MCTKAGRPFQLYDGNNLNCFDGKSRDQKFEVVERLAKVFDSLRKVQWYLCGARRVVAVTRGSQGDYAKAEVPQELRENDCAGFHLQPAGVIWQSFQLNEKLNGSELFTTACSVGSLLLL